jgi:hypothetical protein
MFLQVLAVFHVIIRVLILPLLLSSGTQKTHNYHVNKVDMFLQVLAAHISAKNKKKP